MNTIPSSQFNVTLPFPPVPQSYRELDLPAAAPRTQAEPESSLWRASMQACEENNSAAVQLVEAAIGLSAAATLIIAVVQVLAF